jgi:hypothetical protein
LLPGALCRRKQECDHEDTRRTKVFTIEGEGRKKMRLFFVNAFVSFVPSWSNLFSAGGRSGALARQIFSGALP